MFVTQLCLTLCDPRNCSPPASSVHGILQARIQEWVAIPFSRGSSWPRDWTQISCTAGGFFTVWTTREASRRMCTGYMHLLRCFTWGAWTFVDFGSCRESWNQSPADTKGQGYSQSPEHWPAQSHQHMTAVITVLTWVSISWGIVRHRIQECTLAISSLCPRENCGCCRLMLSNFSRSSFSTISLTLKTKKRTNKSFTVLNNAQGSYLVVQDQHFILVCNILQISH